MKMKILGLALTLMQAAASAQTWPHRPLRAVVPVGAGSSTDIVHRLVLEQLSARLGQPIVIENRVGAGGTIGTAIVAKAEPNGNTLLAIGSAHTIAPALYKNLPYDPTQDFTPVVSVGISPSVLVVSPARGYRTVQTLVASARSRPGALNFSSVGVGTATHLSAERLASSMGLNVVHVPFKGGSEAMVEVIAGRVDFFFGPVALVLSQVKEGKLLALAVNSTKRSAVLSEVPTLQEAGCPNAEYPIWFGLFAPAKTPRPIVDRLNSETLAVLRSPTLSEKLTEMGVDPLIMAPDAFKRYVDQEFVLNAALAKQAGLKAN